MLLGYACALHHAANPIDPEKCVCSVHMGFGTNLFVYNIGLFIFARVKPTEFIEDSWHTEIEVVKDIDFTFLKN
jgi:hypothetical protein